MARPFTAKTKWAIAFACTAALGVALWLASPSRHSEALVVGFSGFTNHESARVAIFDITNQSKVPLMFLVAIERKTGSGWPIYPLGAEMPHKAPGRIGQDSTLKPGETYRLLITPPTGEGFTAWRLSVGCAQIHSAGKLDRPRQVASKLASDVGLQRLSAALGPGEKAAFILGSEMSK